MASKSEDSKEDNVKVAIRCRPMSPGEVADGRKVAVHVDQLRGQVSVEVAKSRSTEKQKTFTFDSVFGFESKQTDIYNETARPIVDSVLEGFNGTIFAYGQTGTGKTYTMEGETGEPEKRGIIPNSFAHIFGHIAKCEGQVQFLVRVSYLELYNEDVHDLLSKKGDNKLELRERPDIGVYVKDLSSFVVKNADEMDKLMSIGNKKRSFAATAMNDRSSRSHVIFTITIERCELGPDRQQHVRMGKLHLVDLAGSERQSKTGATGKRLKEAMKINLSLLTLGNVIFSLVNRRTHIPYRNSKLTILLQDSLGGNSKTVMIANIGPANYNCDESLNTLRYANRAKNIKNSAHINEDPKDAMLREFQKEIEMLRNMLDDGSEGSEEESEDNEDTPGKKHKHRKRKHKRRDSAGPLSPRAVSVLRQQIEKERTQLMAKKDLAEGERNTAHQELKRREDELKKSQEQHDQLEKKLQDLQSKVIVGGVNLLEQAEEQEKLLEESARELKKRKKKEAKLKEQLQKKEAERQDIEERYASLQEEAVGKTKKLKEVWKQFQQTKEEIADMRAEFQQENEEMLATIRELSQEVKLQALIMDSYIPAEYQEQLESCALWHEDTGEWHMRGIAYAGNNMKKVPSPEPVNPFPGYDTTSAYLTYTVGPHQVYTLPTTSMTGGIGGGSARPKGARKLATSSTTTKSSRKKEEKEEKEEEFPTSRGLVSRQRRFA